MTSNFEAQTEVGITVAQLAEATGSTIGEVLSWDREEFAIAQAAFAALAAKRNNDTGGAGGSP